MSAGFSRETPHGIILSGAIPAGLSGWIPKEIPSDNPTGKSRKNKLQKISGTNFKKSLNEKCQGAILKGIHRRFPEGALGEISSVSNL